MRWMCFNARIDLLSDGEDAFSYRLPHILSFLKQQSPDIIGFQELSPSMLKQLKEALTDYVAVGEARDKDGEANPIFLKRCYTIIETKTTWYSGQKHEAQKGAHYPRTWTRVTFEHQGRSMMGINTHLSHVSSTARKDAVKQLDEFCLNAAKTLPIVLMGDFNSVLSEGILAPLNEVLTNVWDHRDLEATFHGFSKPTMTEPIDYIFYSSHWHCQVFTLHNQQHEKLLSDHYPLQATLSPTKKHHQKRNASDT